MADDSDAERTEPASPRRLEKAREDGDVPRSREIATFTVLMTAGACLWMFGGSLVGRLGAALQSGLSLDREQVYNPDILLERILNDVVGVLLTMAGWVLLSAGLGLWRLGTRAPARLVAAT